jgi:hypothetical protein
MLRTLMCTSLMLACHATLWAQILDVRELNTQQIDRLDRARTAVLLTAGILEEHGPSYRRTATAIRANSSPRASRTQLLRGLDERSFGSRRFRLAHSRPATSAGSMCFQGGIRCT